jgi:hypothetical protein
MTENNEQIVSDVEKDKKVRRRKELSLELSESIERFSFPGLREGVYEQLKADEDYVDPDYVTPIDTLLELFKEQGMVVDRGSQLIETDKKSSVVTVRPAATEAGFYGENLLHIKNLNVEVTMDPHLAELIKLANE